MSSKIILTNKNGKNVTITNLDSNFNDREIKADSIVQHTPDRDGLKNTIGAVGDVILQKDIALQYEWVEPQLEDNGGTIINPNGDSSGSWKAIYEGPVNVKWFGAKTGVENSTVFYDAFTKAEDYCYNNSVNMKIDDGEFYSKKPLITRCSIEGSNNTTLKQDFDNLKYGNGELYSSYEEMIAGELETRILYDYNDTTIELFEYIFPKSAILTINSKNAGIEIRNLSVQGGDVYIDSDDKMNLVTPVVCINTFNFAVDNKEMINHFSRNLMENVKVGNAYVGFALTGWVSVFNNLYVNGTKVGAYIFEFNSNTLDIKTENTAKPLDMHEVNSLKIDSFLTEGNITREANIYSRVSNLVFTSYHIEDKIIDKSNEIEIGVREAINEPYVNYMKCYNIKILSMSSVGSLNMLNVPELLKTDKIDYLDISLTETIFHRKTIIKTYNTTNISIKNINKESLPIQIADNTIKSVNLNPNPEFIHGLSTYYITTKDGTHEIVDNQTIGIKKMTNGNVLKLTATGDAYHSTKLYFKHPDTSKYIDKTLYVGVLFYIPDTNVSKNPVVGVTIFNSDTNNRNYSGVRYGQYYYVMLPVDTLPDFNIIRTEFMINGYGTPTNGDVMYILSVDFLTEPTFDRDFKYQSPFCFDRGSYLVYTQTDMYYGEANEKDRVLNPNFAIGNGTSEELQKGNSTSSPSNWKPIGLPSDLPTSNSGAGTVWSNDGVLTLGS